MSSLLPLLTNITFLNRHIHIIDARIILQNHPVRARVILDSGRLQPHESFPVGAGLRRVVVRHSDAVFVAGAGELGEFGAGVGRAEGGDGGVVDGAVDAEAGVEAG